MRACVHVCVRVCMRACMCVCVCVVWVWMCGNMHVDYDTIASTHFGLRKCLRSRASYLHQLASSVLYLLHNCKINASVYACACVTHLCVCLVLDGLNVFN